MNNNNYKTLYNTEKEYNQQLQLTIDSLDDENEDLVLENNKLKVREKILSTENDKLKKSIIASNTALNGYLEEEYVIYDLNNSLKFSFNSYLVKIYQMSYFNNFYRIPKNYKSDITNGLINIQVKRYKGKRFGQVDRHWISDLIINISDLLPIEKYLRGLCERPLKECNKIIDRTKKITKLSNNNYSQSELDEFINVLNQNKIKILNYVLLGNIPQYYPHFLCGVMYEKKERKKITIYKMEDVISYLSQYNFEIKASETVIKLGPLSLQRKGGDRGKSTSNQLQTKLVFSDLNINDKFEFIYN